MDTSNCIDTQRGFDGNRVMVAGGNTTAQLLHPTTMPFERLYRKLPSPGMFDPDVSPSNPFSVNLGAFRVPDNEMLAIFDLSGGVYQFNGNVPGDTEPVSPRSLSSLMGFSLSIDGRTQGNIQFQLEPGPINVQSNPAFPGGVGLSYPVQTIYGPIQTPFQQANIGDFTQAAADSFANASGPGTSTQPQREGRYGAKDIPFTLYAESGQTVAIRAVIWRPIPLPIAFLEYSIQGLLIPQNTLKEILNASKYPQRNRESIR